MKCDIPPAHSVKNLVSPALLFALLAVFPLAPALRANTLIWDPAGVTTGTFDVATTGTWSTTNNLWYSGGSAGNAWSNSTSDIAQFGTASTGTGSYTVTVVGAVSAGGISFAAPSGDPKGYTIQGTSATVTGTINGPAGGIFTISNAGLFNTGGIINNITFTGASTYQFTNTTLSQAGGFNINGGTTFSGGTASVIFGNGTDGGEVAWAPAPCSPRRLPSTPAPRAAGPLM